MSATIDAESLTKYFDDCPMLHIEGLAFPVKDVFLEEILALTKFELPPRPDFLREPKQWQKHAHKHRSAVANVEKEIQYRASLGKYSYNITISKKPVLYTLVF